MNDTDILMGSRKCNKHPGNQVYRDSVREFQPQLEVIGDRTKVAQMVVDHIHTVIGGRFLKVDINNQWHVVPLADVVTKITKALVELRAPLCTVASSKKKVSTSSLLKSIGKDMSSTERPKRKRAAPRKNKQINETQEEEKIVKKRKVENKTKDPNKRMKRTYNVKQIDQHEKYMYKEDPNEFYVEETAHIYHNPPFPSEWPNGVSIEDLRPIPPPPPLPTFPKTGSCGWSFDESSRVLIADFSSGTNSNEEKEQEQNFVMTTEDSRFLFEMYERDDITVISRGLLNLSKVDPSLWSLDYVRRCVGREYYHKFRRFDRVINKKGIEVYTEMDTLYSMRFGAYVQYCDLRKSYLEEKANNNNSGFSEDATKAEEEGEPMFTFDVGRSTSSSKR